MQNAKCKMQNAKKKKDNSFDETKQGKRRLALSCIKKIIYDITRNDKAIAKG